MNKAKDWEKEKIKSREMGYCNNSGEDLRSWTMTEEGEGMGLRVITIEIEVIGFGEWLDQ